MVIISEVIIKDGSFVHKSKVFKAFVLSPVHIQTDYSLGGLLFFVLTIIKSIFAFLSYFSSFL